MPTIETERLVLVSTPLHVIETRLTCDEFSADVALTIEGDEGPWVETWRVYFPAEWPGDALALLPIWKAELESDPGYEMLGGTMIGRAERVAVGQMSFRLLEEEPGTVELGYGVNPSYQGRGYATEMARALVRWAGRQPEIRRITSACLEDNIPSIRVLEKAGFRQIGHRMDDEGRLILWGYGAEMGLSDRDIHGYLRNSVRSREREQVGPFLATFSPHSDNPFLNYAIPDDDADLSPEDVAALIAAYQRRGRKPRLEYLPGAAPNVEGALLAGGFTVEGRLPLMTCVAGQERDLPAPPGIELVVAVEEAELFAALAVQHEAYGEPAPPTPEQIERVQGSVEAGSIYVLARDAATGEPAGAGLCSIPHRGIAEIAAIGVRPAFRRRGIAAALAARLAREAFAAGVTRPFLMAEGPAEERIHARAGFVTTSEMLHISY